MADWGNDIEKYRKGLLTPAERNALERKALNDPFLADALEGAEQISSEDFAFDVKSLNEKILGKKKSVLFTPLRIAAGVVLLIGVSALVYFVSVDSDEQELLTLQTEKSSPETQTSTNSDTVITKNQELLTLNETESESKAGEAKKEEPKPASKSSKPIATEQQPSVATGGAVEETDEIVTLTQTEAEEKSKADLNLSKQAAEEKERLAEAQLALKDEQRDKADDKVVARKEAKRAVAPAEASQGYSKSNANQIISGQVTSSDGSPLPGVNVIAKGTTLGTITDNQGNYTIELPGGNNQQLAFSYIGFHSKEVAVNQSSINTQLEPDVSQLSEVVVVGYGSEDDTPSDPFNATMLMAEPNGGRRAYKKYLETKLQYPQKAIENKVEGRVTIQFIITGTGDLDSFKVIKGIGSGCDEEVIRLVKEGPKWSPARKGELAVDSRMRVRMRFKLPN